MAAALESIRIEDGSGVAAAVTVNDPAPGAKSASDIPDSTIQMLWPGATPGVPLKATVIVSPVMLHVTGSEKALGRPSAGPVGQSRVDPSTVPGFAVIVAEKDVMTSDEALYAPKQPLSLGNGVQA